MIRGGAERGGGERTPSRLHTVSTEPDAGLNLTNCEIMTRAEIKSWTLNRLSHPGSLTCLSVRRVSSPLTEVGTAPSARIYKGRTFVLKQV